MRALAERALRFNTAPAAYAHASWWPAPWQSLVTGSGGRLSTAACNAASVAMMREWNAKAGLMTDFRAVERRLWLAPSEVVMRVAFHVGVSSCLHGIRHAVERTARDQLRADLGDEALAFALTDTAVAMQRALGVTADEPARVATTRATCMRIGAAALIGCVDGEGDDVFSRRARLHFPRHPAIEPILVHDAGALMQLAVRHAAVLEPSCRSLLS